MTTTTTFAQDIQELMTAWNTIMSTARQQFPKATEEEIYQIAFGAMNHALKLS
jgi:hypothetical protein